MKRFYDTVKKVFSSKAFIFLLLAAGMFAVSYSVDLMSRSGDAVETWQVAKTLFAGKKNYSYVMYKGIYAFLPAYIDLKLSALLHIPEQLFVKLFNALCFAYVGTVGVPDLVGMIHPNKKVTVFQRYLLAALFLLLEHHNNLILSVDMSCCALLIALCCQAMRFVSEEKVRPVRILIISLLFGLNMGFSGQFSLSAAIVATAVLITAATRHFKQKEITLKKRSTNFLVILVIFAAGFIATHLPNVLYFALVVDPARRAGEWIPEGSSWLLNGLTQNLLSINYPRLLPDNLGRGFIPGDQLEHALSGGLVYTPRSFIKVVLLHPVQFIVLWCERLFLGMINDPQNHITGLALDPYAQTAGMAIMIYALYDRFFDRFKKYRDIISVDMAVYLSILISVLVPSFIHLENRYYFTARCFVYGVFAISPYLNETAATVKKKIQGRTIEPVSRRFWGCAVFVLLALIIYIALYQSAGVTMFV